VEEEDEQDEEGREQEKQEQEEEVDEEDDDEDDDDEEEEEDALRLRGCGAVYRYVTTRRGGGGGGCAAAALGPWRSVPVLNDDEEEDAMQPRVGGAPTVARVRTLENDAPACTPIHPPTHSRKAVASWDAPERPPRMDV